jgi:hypothetical protein
MAFIVEQAGGKASDGFGRIMELKPTELHERVPFFCGSFNRKKKNLCMTQSISVKKLPLILKLFMFFCLFYFLIRKVSKSLFIC